MHPAKAVGRNEMPFGRDTCVVPSDIVLDWGPCAPLELAIIGSEPLVRRDAACRQIILCPLLLFLLSLLLLLLLLLLFTVNGDDTGNISVIIIVVIAVFSSHALITQTHSTVFTLCDCTIASTF